MELDVLPNPSDEGTEVGSYFVSNYPPFSVWSPEHVPRVDAMLSESPQAPAPKMGLYLHIPFCRKRCKFCYFRVYTDKNSGDIERYMAALAKEIELYAGRRRFSGRQFDFAYFGGGTPSYISSPRSHVRMRTGHAQGKQTQNHQVHRCHPPEFRHRAFR